MEACKKELSDRETLGAMENKKISLFGSGFLNKVQLRSRFQLFLTKLSRLLPKTQKIFFLGYQDDEY